MFLLTVYTLSLEVIQFQSDNLDQIKSQKHGILFFTSEQFRKYNLEDMMTDVNVDDQYGTVNSYFFYCDDNHDVCKQYNIQSLPTIYYISFGKIIHQFSIQDLYDTEVFSDNLNKIMRPVVRSDNVFKSLSEALNHLNQLQINKYYIYEASVLNERQFQRYKMKIDLYFIQLDPSNQDSQNISESNTSRLFYVEDNLVIQKPDAQSMYQFIKKCSREYIAQITQQNVYKPNGPYMRDGILALRANRDVNELTQIRYFMLALKFGIITLQGQLERDVDLVLGRFNLYYVDTQVMLFYVQPYGISQKTKAPVFLTLQKDRARYSKKSFQTSLGEPERCLINKTQLGLIFDLVQQQQNSGNVQNNIESILLALSGKIHDEQIEVPKIFQEFIAFLKDDLRGKNQLFSVNKKHQNAVKIGKNQSYTPPSEGLVTKIQEIILELLQASKKDLIILFLSSLILGGVMAGATKFAIKQTII